MRRAALWWAVVAVAVVATGVLLGPGPTGGPPLDPSSTDPAGTRALIELLEHFGATVTRGLPTEATDTALILEDSLDDEARQELLAWVGDGGVAVVADLGSPLAPPADADSVDGAAVGMCDVDGLRSLRRVAAPELVLLPVGPGAESCFGDGIEAWLVLRPEGAGAVVLLGGAEPLTNANLGRADNAAVATALLLRGPGTRTAVLFDPIVGRGDRSLADLIPDRVWWGMAQLVVAFGLYVAWRARRFGRPVTEVQPVELPGSLLVQARGDLYRRNGARSRVAQELQRDAERKLRRRLGVPSEGPVPVDDVARRLGVPAADVERLLAGPVPEDSQRAVVELADALDDLLRRLEPDAELSPSPGSARSPAPPGGSS